MDCFHLKAPKPKPFPPVSLPFLDSRPLVRVALGRCILGFGLPGSWFWGDLGFVAVGVWPMWPVRFRV